VGKDIKQWNEYINDQTIISWWNELSQNRVDNDFLQFLKANE
jgi:hypothetical protein